MNTEGESREGRWRQHTQAGAHAYAQADYARAEREFRAALEESKLLGGSHRVATLNDLGEACRAQGKYSEAEPLLLQALSDGEEAFGAQAVSVAHTHHNLAALYAAQENFEAAEAHCRKALEIEERNNGTEDPALAASFSNLALVLKARGQLAEALEVSQRALRLWQRASKDLPAATALNNMGVICCAQGKMAEAESLLKKALEMKEKVLGPAHPEVAAILSNLAGVYEARERFVEARPLIERLIDADEGSLGAEHPQLAEDWSRLARTMEAAGKRADADALYRKAAGVREGASERPPAAAREDVLAAGKLESLSGDAVPVAAAEAPGPQPEKMAGAFQFLAVHGLPGQLANLPAARNLAEMAEQCIEQEKFREAEALYEGILALEAPVQGAQGLAVAAAMNNLGRIYEALGRPEQAARLFQCSVATALSSGTSATAYVAVALNNLAAISAVSERFAEAEALCEQSLHIHETGGLPEGPVYETIRTNLARIYQARK